MRCFFTTSLERTEAIFRDGWTDLYDQSSLFGWRGVYFATIQLDANDGFDGDVTLCLNVPEEDFADHETTDTLMEKSGYRMALIPAQVLNRIGKPQVYDHTYAGAPRRLLVRRAEQLEETGVVSHFRHAQQMREAIALFDRIGWLTPLKLREQGVEN
jgi:hypothetical protein